MKIRLTRRAFVRVISYAVAVSLALGAAAFSGSRRAAAAEQKLLVVSQGALSELCEHLDSIAVDLQKGLYTNSVPLLARLEGSLSQSAACAKLCLSQLTEAGLETETIYKFLSQVGAYTHAVGQRLQSGKTLSAKQRESLAALEAYARSLSSGFGDLRASLDDGLLQFDPPKTTLRLTGNQNTASFGSSFQDTEQALADYPTLLYDGPFSDSLLERDALAVKAMDEISPQTAQTRAAKWLGCKETELLRESDAEGSLPLYCFSKGGKTIGLTKRGGLAAYIINPSFAGEAQISEKTAKRIARKYLEQLGYRDMKATYSSTYDGVCTIVFHSVKDSVTYYADLIKVGVALDSAAVVALDARGYLMNHTARTLPQAQVSREDAQTALSPALTVLGGKTAMIPLDTGKEALCHEFHCRDEAGQELLIYTDVTDGSEADLQLLLYADGGVLAR